MKKTLLISVIMLSGCAGMNSDFDCNKTATDQCLTMEQAQNLASEGKSLDDVSKEGQSAKKPVTRMLSTKVLSNNPPVITEYSNITASTKNTSQGSISAGRSSESSNYSSVKIITRTNPDSAGTVKAIRYQDVTQRLWISPWVDKDDNFHQPSVIEFVHQKSSWKQNFNSIGDGD